MTRMFDDESCDCQAHLSDFTQQERLSLFPSLADIVRHRLRLQPLMAKQHYLITANGKAVHMVVAQPPGT